jgi:hypothetical protein
MRSLRGSNKLNWRAVSEYEMGGGITILKNYSINIYEGDSNENFKSAIKIQKTARLSCKLTIMILMV